MLYTETMEIEPMYLPQISAEVVAILRERATEGGIAWEADVPSVEPFPYVYGSPLHLRQIFLNIHGDCIKFTNPGGKITTRMECLSRSKDTVTYRWTISDTGIGMSEEFLKHTFDPFVQENSSARSQYQGTGLNAHLAKPLEMEKVKQTISEQVRK